ncbi:MAG: hypothetical protein GFH24_608434n2 [Chloroflexi bacterium AL-N5]|nr:hypothetical protein [Chloroflexi bacterium AL-N5]
MSHKQRWLIFSPLGLALIGFGASMLGYSIELKTLGADTVTWFIWGTFSLIVLNSGVAVFGEAVKHRLLYEKKP